MKKKLVLVLGVILVALVLIPTISACAPRTDILKIFSWDEYIHEDFINNDEEINGFKQYYKAVTGRNVEISYDTFTQNEDMFIKIANGSDYDLVCPSDYTLQKMMSENMLKPLMSETEINDAVNALYAGSEKPANLEEYVSNKGNVSNFIWEKVAELGVENIEDYFAPYMWGTMGILYNKSLMTAEHQADADDKGVPNYVKSWDALFDANSPYDSAQNGFYMKVNMRDSFAIAAVQTFIGKDGYGNDVSKCMNVSSASEVNMVLETLKAQKKLRAFKGLEAEEGKPELASGSGAVMSLQWSGDAVWAKANAAANGIDGLGYYVPEEGSNIWFDGFCIPKQAQNTLAANLWINYMCDSDVAIKNMEYIGYTSAIGTDKVAAWCNYYYHDESAEKVYLDDRDEGISYFFNNDLTNTYQNGIYIDTDQFPTNKVVERCAVMLAYSDEAKVLIENAWKTYLAY